MKTVRDQLELDTFRPSGQDITQVNPLDIDISEFDDVKDSLPSNTQLDIGIAVGLAANYLRAADRCGEILSSLTWWEQRAKNDKKKIFSKAWLRARENGARTDSMAKHTAENDEEYIEACNAEIDAMTVREHFVRKHQAFLKAHHYMKDRIKSEQFHMNNASGFSETVDSEGAKNGEVDWT